MDDNQSLPVIDRELSLKLAGNNQELAEEILALLVKILPGEIDGIGEALGRMDYEEMARLVHKLRGAVAYCGVPILAKFVLELECGLKIKEFEKVESHFQEVELAANKLIASYQSFLPL